MTSEFDTIGGLIGELRKRTEDPIVQRGLELLATYVSSFHQFSHDIAMGRAKFPKDFLMGYVQFPKTDHWASMVPSLASNIKQISDYTDQLQEIARAKKGTIEKLKAATEREGCQKDHHGLCFCPICAPEFHQNE